MALLAAQQRRRLIGQIQHFTFVAEADWGLTSGYCKAGIINAVIPDIRNKNPAIAAFDQQADFHNVFGAVSGALCWQGKDFDDDTAGWKIECILLLVAKLSTLRQKKITVFTRMIGK